jgi:hypothetical protein
MFVQLSKTLLHIFLHIRTIKLTGAALLEGAIPSGKGNCFLFVSINTYWVLP